MHTGIFAPCNSDLEYLASGIQGVESRIQDCPGFPFFRARDMVPKSPVGITSPFSLVFENAEKLSFKFSCWGFCPLEVYCPHFHIPYFKDFFKKNAEVELSGLVILDFDPSTSPLESFVDSPQLSVSFNVQDGGRTSFALQNTPVFRLETWNHFRQYFLFFS